MESLRRVKLFKNEQVEEKVPPTGDGPQVVRTRKVWKKFPDGEGLFHRWGLDYEELDNGVGLAAGNYTVAIVELDDGTVKLMSVDDIQFIK